MTTNITLARFAITDRSKIALQTFHSDARIENKKVIFSEQTSVYYDDMEAQQRIVLRFMVRTRKVRNKRVPVPSSIVTAKVTVLNGYDETTNMWGSLTISEWFNELSETEAWALHQECAALRDAMRYEHGSWYRQAA